MLNKTTEYAIIKIRLLCVDKGNDMRICAINSIRTFGAQKGEYENPVNQKTEKRLAILGSVGASALAGATAFGITSCLTSNRKTQGAAGLTALFATLALSLPSKLYNTKVGAFAREKEMDVFSRQKEAQKNIYEDVNKEIKNEDVSLDDKIKHYATVAMADNGKGVMVKGA